MKTVSGEVVSTKPVSLSKAARILSKFASSDNGASPAFAAYLKRASASFDELAQLHKKYKTSRGKQKLENSIESRLLQEVNTKVKSNNSVINRDEIREHRGVNKVKNEDETKAVSLNVDEERHKSKKKIKEEGERKRDSLNAEEERHKSKKAIKEEAKRKRVSLNVDEERHKSNKKIKDEENMHKSKKKGRNDDGSRNKKRKRGERHDLD